MSARCLACVPVVKFTHCNSVESSEEGSSKNTTETGRKQARKLKKRNMNEENGDFASINDPYLVILRGNHSPQDIGKKLHLPHGKITVGLASASSTQPDIIIKGSGVARRQCLFENLGEGVVVLHPIAASCFLEGKSVSHSTVLTPDCLICLGRSNVFRFYPGASRTTGSANEPHSANDESASFRSSNQVAHPPFSLDPTSVLGINSPTTKTPPSTLTPRDPLATEQELDSSFISPKFPSAKSPLYSQGSKKSSILLPQFSPTLSVARSPSNSGDLTTTFSCTSDNHSADSGVLLDVVSVTSSPMVTSSSTSNCSLSYRPMTSLPSFGFPEPKCLPTKFSNIVGSSDLITTKGSRKEAGQALSSSSNNELSSVAISRPLIVDENISSASRSLADKELTASPHSTGANDGTISHTSFKKSPRADHQCEGVFLDSLDGANTSPQLERKLSSLSAADGHAVLVKALLESAHKGLTSSKQKSQGIKSEGISESFKSKADYLNNRPSSAESAKDRVRPLPIMDYGGENCSGEGWENGDSNPKRTRPPSGKARTVEAVKPCRSPRALSPMGRFKVAAPSRIGEEPSSGLIRLTRPPRSPPHGIRRKIVNGADFKNANLPENSSESHQKNTGLATGLYSWESMPVAEESSKQRVRYLSTPKSNTLPRTPASVMRPFVWNVESVKTSTKSNVGDVGAPSNLAPTLPRMLPITRCPSAPKNENVEDENPWRTFEELDNPWRANLRADLKPNLKNFVGEKVFPRNTVVTNVRLVDFPPGRQQSPTRLVGSGESVKSTTSSAPDATTSSKTSVRRNAGDESPRAELVQDERACVSESIVNRSPVDINKHKQDADFLEVKNCRTKAVTFKTVAETEKSMNDDQTPEADNGEIDADSNSVKVDFEDNKKIMDKTAIHSKENAVEQISVGAEEKVVEDSGSISSEPRLNDLGGSTDLFDDLTASQEDLKLLHQRMMEEREKEQEIAELEKKRLEEISSICAEYERQHSLGGVSGGIEEKAESNLSLERRQAALYSSLERPKAKEASLGDKIETKEITKKEGPNPVPLGTPSPLLMDGENSSVFDAVLKRNSASSTTSEDDSATECATIKRRPSASTTDPMAALESPNLLPSANSATSRFNGWATSSEDENVRRRSSSIQVSNDQTVIDPRKPFRAERWRLSAGNLPRMTSERGFSHSKLEIGGKMSELENLLKVCEETESRIGQLKQKMVDIDSQKSEIVSEVEMERALLEGEHNGELEQMKRDHKLLTRLKERQKELVEEAAIESEKLQRDMETLGSQLSDVDAQLIDRQNFLDNISMTTCTTDNSSAAEEEIGEVQQEIFRLRLQRDRLLKAYDQLQSQIDDKSALRHRQLQLEIMPQQSQLLDKYRSREKKLEEIGRQQKEILSFAWTEIEGLELERQVLREKLTEEMKKLREVQKSVGRLMSNRSNLVENPALDGSSETEPMTITERPSHTVVDNPVQRFQLATVPNKFNFDKASISLSLQGRSDSLEKLDHPARKNRKSLGSLESDESHTGSSSGTSVSDKDFDGKENSQLDKVADMEKSFTRNQLERLQLIEEQPAHRDHDELQALQIERQRRMELECRLEEEIQRREEIVDKQIRMREKERIQARPLTRYLPVREKSFDLRRFIESCGHNVEQCGQHITLTTTSCQGYLQKMGSQFKTWNRRYFVFDRLRRSLNYFADRQAGKPRGTIYFQAIEEVYVDHLRTVKSSNPRLTFCIKTYDRTYYLMAPTPEAMRIWIDVIFTGAEGYREFL